MKFLVTPHNIDNISKLTMADGFIVGNSEFATSLANSFSIGEINQIIEYCQNNSQEVFLNLQKMYLDEEFNDLSLFLTKLNVKKLTGIITIDLGVVQHLIDLDLADKIVFNGETLLTNYLDFNMLKPFNVYGGFVAKEITFDDILEISNHKAYHLFLIGHGHLSMFYSKRALITNFKKHYNLSLDEKKYSYKILENKREGSPFPILQDQAGTHVYRSKVVNSFPYLDQLKPIVDYFVIDSIFKDDDYIAKILDLYLNDYNKTAIAEIQQQYNETWDDGFYDVKTVYLKEKL